ncbi:MAG: riboflavin synthase subunit alpha [Neisseria sp.]|nr:riboflavin synthase subunit alpha [Neisseria sp.]
MFTGIVQGMGEVVAVREQENFRTLSVRLPEQAAQNLTIGASVANNGCCLTITRIDGNQVDFDVMGETLAKTNLGALRAGDRVNIERAARFGDEIGGHVMSGHVMGTVTLMRVDEDAHNRSLWFRLPERLRAYVLEKGFVGLDGCSLTVGTVTDDAFNVHLIPETLNRTLFGTRQVGDAVNLEIDAQTQAVVDTVTRVLAARGR